MQVSEPSPTEEVPVRDRLAAGSSVSEGAADIDRPAQGLFYFRLLLYIVLPGAIMAIFTGKVADAGSDKVQVEALLSEGGVIEWTQVGVCIVLTLLVWNCAVRLRTPLHTLLAVLAAMAVVRELDGFLEDVIRQDFHRRMLDVLTLFVLVYWWYRRKELAVNMASFVRRPGFWLMLAGFAVLGIYAQVLGDRDAWRQIAVPVFRSEAKRLAEEPLELVGYLLVMAGALEERFFSGLRRKAA